MDVQVDNIDPPPGEAQPAGKIRKGFKLFGKGKPRSIFSLRRKGDQNKSPVVGSNALDGLPEQGKEPEEVSRGEKGEGEREGGEEEQEEPLGKDGEQLAAAAAAAPPRHSISSTASAKSLSFLSLLRGGRRVAAGDRRVHTVSQPVGRHRRGLRGLFGSVRFRHKEREDTEDAPPSPLFLSSRANSVEIIKEDLTLTPKAQQRSADGPDASQPAAGGAPRATAVSTADEAASPLPAAATPMEPGDSSLSSLLADISSLLTFDSISGGGDIMADVEAEWGKASAAIGAMGTGGRSPPLSSPSEPVLSSPRTPPSSVSVTSAERPSLLPSLDTFSTQSFTYTTKPAISSSPLTNPSPLTTFSTKSYTLAMPSLKSGSASKAPVIEATKMTTFIRSSPPSTATTNLAPMTSTSFSPPLMSCPLITMTWTPYSTSVITAASQPPASVVKSSSISPTLTSTAAKSAPEDILNIAPASLPSAVAKAVTVTCSPPVAFSIPLSAKLDSTNALGSQKTFQSSITEASNAPASTAVASSLVVQTKSPSSAPVVTSKMPVVPTPATAPLSSSVMLSGSTRPPDPIALDKDYSVLVSTPGPDFTNTPALQSSNKPQASPPPIQTSSSSFQSSVKPQPSPPPVQMSASLPVTSVKPKPTPSPNQTSAQSPLPSAKLQTTPAPMQTSAQSPLPSAKLQTTPAPMQTSAPSPLSSAKLQTTPAPMQTSAQSPLPSAKLQTTPAPMQTSAPSPLPSVKLQPTLGPIQTSSPTPVSSVQPTLTPTPTSTPGPLDKVSTTSMLTPMSVILDKNPPIFIPTTISKVALPAQTLAPNTIPYPIPPNSLSKTPTAAVPDTHHAISPPAIPAALMGDAQSSARIKDAIQASVDGGLARPSTMNAKGPQTTSQKREEPHAILQGPIKDKRTPPTKSGLSKIPVVGGGRAGKLPVRESQNTDEEGSSDPPTPVLEEERPRLGLQSRESKDKICDIDPSVHPSQHIQQECQRPQQPKVISSAPRDSKIPVKQGAHGKDAPRTKIPVSKVPVRRTGNKPAGTGIPIRK